MLYYYEIFASIAFPIAVPLLIFVIYDLLWSGMPHVRAMGYDDGYWDALDGKLHQYHDENYNYDK